MADTADAHCQETSNTESADIAARDECARDRDHSADVDNEDEISCGMDGEVIANNTPSSEIPSDSCLVNVIFADSGSLGVILKRSDGIGRIDSIQSNTQAVDQDIKVSDELWSVGPHSIGTNKLDKPRWDELIEYMKATRPLHVILRRRLEPEERVPPPFSLQATVSASSESSPSATLPPRPTSPPNTKSSTYTQLERVASRLAFKDREKSAASILSRRDGPSVDAAQNTSVLEMLTSNPSRRLIKEGVVDVRVKGALWSSNQQRFLFLFTDLLIVAIQGGGATQQKLTIESIIELQAAKLYSHGQCFKGGTTGDAGRRGSITTKTETHPHAFELYHPNGILHILVDSEDEKEVWVLTMFLAICELVRVSGAGEGFGWKHQIMLGTMHSAVVHRDLGRVEELLSMHAKGTLDTPAIEEADHEGYTPLHIACMLRLNDIAYALHGAGADVTIPDFHGLTPIHMSALQLDHGILQCLSANVFDTDIQDRGGRTPLCIACIEGRAVSGATDQRQLRASLDILLAQSADPDGGLLATDAISSQMFLPIHYLASSWQADPLEALLQHGAHVNHIGSTYIGTFAQADTGVMYSALHCAARGISIKRAVGLGHHIITQKMEGAAASTHDETSRPLSALVDSKQTVSLESLSSSTCIATFRTLLQHGSWSNALDSKGRSALSILAASEQDWFFSGATHAQRGEVCALLIAFGARMDDSAACQQLRAKFPEIDFDAGLERWASSPPVNADLIGLQVNSLSISTTTSPSSSPTITMSSKGSTLCVLCSAGFSLFKRQHHCRLCSAICCDDCSKRRAIIDGTQVRVCDGCFNVALHRVDLRQKSSPVSVQSRPSSPFAQNTVRPRSKTSPHTADQYAANRSELFKGHTPSSAPMTQKDGIAGTTATMNEVADRLRERGQKLEKLGDKSADMANAAGDFAKLAKQLNEQQRKYNGFW